MDPGEANLDNRITENSEETPLIEVAVHGTKRIRCPITIEPILLALCLADGLSDAVVVNFILMRTCEIHFKFNKSICSQLNKSYNNETSIYNIIQPYSSFMLTGMHILSTFLPAMMSFFFGPWSDYNGRKLMIIVPALGYFLKYTMLGVFSFFPNLGPEYALFVVIPVALSGGFVTFLSAAHAYISDISSVANRSSRISLLSAIMLCGLIVGSTSTSYIYSASEAYGFVLIFWVSASIIFITVIFTFFFVPESVENIDIGKGLWHVFEYKFLKEMLQVSFKKREGYQRAVIFLVIASLSISSAVGEGESNILFLFTKLRFGWGIKEFSLWISLIFTIMFLGIFLGIYVFMKCLKISDAKLGILIYGLKAVHSFCVAFIPANAPYLMYYCALINIFQALGTAVCRSILSKTVPKEDLGKIFFLTSTSECIFPLAIGPLYTILYNATIKSFPGTFLLISGSLFVLCFIFFRIIDIVHKSNTQTQFNRLENEPESG